MIIATAKLIKGSEVPVGDGKTKPFRASVRIGEDRPISAIIKRIPKIQVVAECYAAVLLTKWKLPVPTPLLVIDGDELLFGSTRNTPV